MALFEIDLGQKIILVEGNHEEKHKRYRKHCIENPEIAKSMESLQPELSSITKSLSKDNIDLLENAIPFFRIEKHNFLIVHGGIPNNMWNFPTSLEEINASSKSKKYFSQTLRTRYVCSKTGRMLDLGKEGPDDLYWADVYNGRFGTVIFGHQPFPNRPKIFPNAIGIDTGAVYGYGLTAMIVEESGSYNFIIVPTQEYQTYNKHY
jgi:diadenosine tetraphosphatase ApaH/serine/threonine PP2A family protein phosphatase